MKQPYLFSEQNFMMISKLDSINVTHDKRANGELGLVEQILCGNIPVLSLNQAIDSPIIVNSLLTEANNTSRNRHMLSLFKDGIIRVKEFKQFSNIISYVDYQLASHINTPAAPFVFSSIPFLNTADDTYHEEELVEIFRSMRESLAKKRPQDMNNCPQLSKFEGHRTQIESYLHAMILLDEATKGHFTEGVQSNQIPEEHKLLGLLSSKLNWMKEEENRVKPQITPGLIALIEELIRVGEEQPEERRHSRSILYNYLMNRIGRSQNNDYSTLHSLPTIKLLENGCEDVFYACAVIDICYNEAIAYSVSDEGLRNEALDAGDPLVVLFDKNNYVVENSTAVIGEEEEVRQVTFSDDDE